MYTRAVNAIPFYICVREWNSRQYSENITQLVEAVKATTAI